MTCFKFNFLVSRISPLIFVFLDFWISCRVEWSHTHRCPWMCFGWCLPYCTVWCMLLRSKDRVPSVHPSRTALFFNFSDPAPAAPIKKGTHHFILLPSLHHFFIISSSFSFSLHHCHPTNRTIIRQKGMFWKIGWLLFYKRENMVDITMFSKLIFATESLRMLPIGIYVFCFSVCSIFIFFPTESLRMIPIGIYVFFLSVRFLFFSLRNHCAWFPLESMFFVFLSVRFLFIFHLIFFEFHQFEFHLLPSVFQP